MDQPRRAQLHLPAAHDPAGRGLRRGHVLRAVLARAAAAGRGARLHRHRLHGGRREAAVRRSRGPDRAEGRAARQQRRRARRGPDLAREPVPGDVRDGAGGDGHHRRRGAARGLRRPRRGRRHRDACSPAATLPRRSPRRCRRRGIPGCGSCAASAGSTRRASTAIARTAATRPCAPRSTWASRACCARSADAKLLGRGGAAFPTGRKWEAVAAHPTRPHYLICNADESEPGTFKDRVLLEHDPFSVIESMTIAGFATGCEHGYLYLRGEYPLAWERLVGRRHRGAGARLPRPGHLRPRHQLRHRAAQGRGRVHLRRGDGALQLDRGLSRRAAQQAAVPDRARAVRQADGDQQRRDAGQRPRHRPRRRPGLRADRHRGLDGHAPVLPLGPGRRGPGCTRRRSASPSARCSTWPAA